ncbi:MAG: L-threonylcarbamoyladenylate synthase [Gammaproteobacteria bacterium]|jgi:L-threonylcarbamoyladenylate synthase
MTIAGPGFFEVRRMANLLRAGGVIAYPTEGVYGLGCDPLNQAAVERILRLKGRSAGKGLILIGADETQLWPFIQIVDDARMSPVRNSWPGPVTWVFPARDDINPLISGGRRTVAVRVTSHPGAAALCAAFGGALISTSANVSGAKPARTRLRVQRELGAHIDGIARGRVGERRQPSTIRNVADAQFLRGNAADE